MADATLQVPKDVIEPIIRQHVASAVAQALAGRDEIVTACVHQVLNMKVDERGSPSSYSHNVTWLQWVMGECLKKAVRDAITEELDKHKDKLKEAIVKDLRNTKSGTANALAKAMVEGFADADHLRYAMKLEFKP